MMEDERWAILNAIVTYYKELSEWTLATYDTMINGKRVDVRVYTRNIYLEKLNPLIEVDFCDPHTNCRASGIFRTPEQVMDFVNRTLH